MLVTFGFSESFEVEGVNCFQRVPSSWKRKGTGDPALISPWLSLGVSCHGPQKKAAFDSRHRWNNASMATSHRPPWVGELPRKADAQKKRRPSAPQASQRATRCYVLINNRRSILIDDHAIDHHVVTFTRVMDVHRYANLDPGLDRVFVEGPTAPGHVGDRLAETIAAWAARFFESDHATRRVFRDGAVAIGRCSRRCRCARSLSPSKRSDNSQRNAEQYFLHNAFLPFGYSGPDGHIFPLTRDGLASPPVEKDSNRKVKLDPCGDRRAVRSQPESSEAEGFMQNKKT